MHAGPLASAIDIRMSFGGIEVLKGVTLDLRPGEVHAITGENGAGKSTLAKIVAGVHRPTHGHVEIDGQETKLRSPREAADLGIALIHQEPLIFPHLTVAENIFIGRQPQSGPRIDWRATYEKAQEILRNIGSKLNPRARVEGLSIANQQMVELAAALSQNAKVLILDETTASLTPKEVEDLFRVVRRLRDDGRAIAFVSHRLEEVFAISNRITVLRDGEKVGELKPETSGIDEVVRLMVGRETQTRLSTQRTVGQTPVLETESLSSPGSFNNISFTIKPGEIVALAGLVGSGRTEVAEAMFGIGKTRSGRVKVDGRETDIRSPRGALRHGLALVPEDRQHHGLLMPASISDNATLAILSRLSKIWTSQKRERETAAPYAESLRVAMRDLAQPVRELSGGNQQKVVLAKWLLTKPKVLIVDEPTRGVDVGAKAEVHRLLSELAGEGLAILMISSDLTEVLQMADRILVMRGGSIAAEFTREEADAEKVMFAAAGQVAHAI